MSLKRIIAAIGLFIPAITLMAQERSQSDWEAAFAQSVSWTRTTPFGNLLVHNGEGLHGVDPGTGKTLWSRTELKNLDENRYEPIEGSPFITLGTADNSEIFIIEPFEGTVVFQSRQAGISSIIGKYVLPANLSLLIHGNIPGQDKPSIVMVDLSSGKKLWDKHDDFGMLTAFIELGADQFLIATLWKIYRIHTRTGEVEWEKPIDPKASAQMAKLGALGGMLKNLAEQQVDPNDIKAEFYPLESDAFIVGAQVKNEKTTTDSQGNKKTTITYSSTYNAYKMSTGDPMWPKPAEFKGYLGQLIFDERGIIVCPDAGANTRINLLDYKTGETSWGKKGRGIKARGGVQDYYLTDAGILLLFESGGSKGSSTFRLNMLDPATGMLKFDKYLKVDGRVRQTEILPSGLFFVTESEANLIDLATGTEKFDKSVKTKPLLNVGTDDRIYIFSLKDDKVYAVDKNAGTLSPFSKAEIKFDGKEDPDELELRESGIAIVGKQNVALVGMDGSVKYNNYFPAPRLPGLLRAIYAAQAIRMAYVGAVSTYASGALAAYAQQEKDAGKAALGQGFSEVYGAMGQAGFAYAGMYLDAVKSRFKATANAPDFVFMVMDTEARDNHLIRVSKDNGEIMDYINLGKEKEPVYEVDNISNQVYYRKTGNKISCFKF